MDSLIETFHIDIKLLVAQLINFGIVFSVLYVFAMKPLVKVMQERTKKIEKSLAEAKEIEVKLSKTEADYSAEMARAKKEADTIITKAKEQAETRKEDMVKKAKEEIGRMINEGKAELQNEKQETLREIRRSVADLVYSGMEKVLGKTLDAKEDKEIIKKIIK